VFVPSKQKVFRRDFIFPSGRNYSEWKSWGNFAGIW